MGCPSTKPSATRARFATATYCCRSTPRTGTGGREGRTSSSVTAPRQSRRVARAPRPEASALTDTLPASAPEFGPQVRVGPESDDGKEVQMDAIELLTDDHDKVRGLFKEFA